jgi:hypothetical protein
MLKQVILNKHQKEKCKAVVKRMMVMLMTMTLTLIRKTTNETRRPKNPT